MLRYTLTSLALSVLLVATASSQESRVLQLTPLTVEFPATWAFEGARSSLEGRGPKGERMRISVMRLREGVASKSADDNAGGFANTEMRRMGKDSGMSVIRDVAKYPVEEGKAAYSMASQSTSLFGGTSFFLQYLFASPRAVIYFTIEGSGEAEPVAREFDEHFRTLRWNAGH